MPAMAPLANTEITRNGTLKKNETAPPKITIGNRAVGGKAVFTCPQGFLIEGESEAVCQSNGQWSNDIPLCKGINTATNSRGLFSNDFMSIMPSSKSSYTNRNWNQNRRPERRKGFDKKNNFSAEESYDSKNKGNGNFGGGSGVFPMARH